MHRGAVALLLGIIATPLLAQDGDWQDRIEVRRDAAVFTMWSWITLADTAQDRATWPLAKLRVRERLESRLPSAYVDSLRAVYERRRSTQFDWHATMIALHLTRPPAMRWDPVMLDPYDRGVIDTTYLRYLQRIGNELLPMLNEFHERADLAGLLAECAEWYDPAISRQRAGTISAVQQALSYLRLDGAALSAMSRIIIVPNLVGPPGTAMGPRFGERLFDVETPRAGDGHPEFTAHEYIHQMVGAVVRDSASRDRILGVVRAVQAQYAGTAAARYYPDPVSYFEESLVRTLDFSARLGPELAYDNERLKRALGYQYDAGFVLVRPMRDALVEFEQSTSPFTAWFPQFLRAVEAGAAAGAADDYRMVVALEPQAGSLAADARITYRAPIGGAKSIEYLLNAGLTLLDVTSTVPIESVHRDTTRRGEYRYAPRGDPVRLVLLRPLRGGETTEIRFRYGGKLAPDEWGVNRITPQWTELGLYSAWYPLRPGALLRYVLDLSVPGGWSVSSAGDVVPGRGGRFHISSSTATTDIPFAAATGFRHDMLAAGAHRIHVHHTGLDDGDARMVGRLVAAVLDMLTSRYGAADGLPVQLVFAPRERGGGYARPGYIVLQHDSALDVSSTGFLRFLAHELAHLWWSGAREDTWEDWLNESFAEYEALAMLRARLEHREWQSTVERYREAARAAPPIRGLDRNAPEAEAALYRAGPLILLELEQQVGREAFERLLREFRAAPLRNTEALLAGVQKVTSKEARALLAERLERGIR